MPAKKEKTPTTNQPTKIFDVAKPGTALTPSMKSTTRPVLVTNRPLMQDPMMLPKEETPAQPMAPTATKVVIKPLRDSEVTEEAESATSGDKKVSKDSKSDEEHAKPEATETPAETDGKSIEVKLEAPTSSKFDPSKYQPSSAAAQPSKSTAAKSDEKPVIDISISSSTDGPQEPAEADSPAETADSSDDSVESTDSMDTGTDLSPDKTKLDKETAELEEAAKRAAEIDQLVEDKKYFLPINAVERRRSKQVILLGLVISVLLALLWVNMALDAGMIDLGGVEPLTDIL